VRCKNSLIFDDTDLLAVYSVHFRRKAELKTPVCSDGSTMPGSGRLHWWVIWDDVSCHRQPLHLAIIKYRLLVVITCAALQHTATWQIYW